MLHDPAEHPLGIVPSLLQGPALADGGRMQPFDELRGPSSERRMLGPEPVDLG